MSPFFTIRDKDGTDHLIRKADVSNVVRLEDPLTTKIFFEENRVRWDGGGFIRAMPVDLPIHEVHQLLSD